jgi:hypothetical protein
MRLKRTVLRSERGMALFATFLMLLLVLSLGGASLVQSVIDLRATSHYKTGVQAFMAAESGAVHGLSAINQKRVRNFKIDIVDQWDAAGGSLLGAGRRTLLGDAKSDYSVTVEADPTNLQNSGFIVGSGWAPLEANRVVALQVRRADFVGTQGAIYLVDDNVNDFTVNGNNVKVQGEDHLANGALNPNGTDVPAITTRNDTVNNVVVGGIAGRADQFTGVGYDDSDKSNIKPSVLALGGPSKQDIDNVVDDILPDSPIACPGKKDDPLGSPWICASNESSVNGADLPMGTQEHPVIIHLTNKDGIKINGPWTGYGIIIADGQLDINGNASFFGLIVARGGFDPRMNGNATILGSVWSYAPTMTVGGSLLIENSQQALEFADNAGLGSNMGGNLPRQVVVVGWDER